MVRYGQRYYRYYYNDLHFPVIHTLFQDPLVLCVGPRRLGVNPIYSQHTRGGGKGANNVHKFERYLRHGVTSVATTYGPVIYGKQPCVLLRETLNGEGESRPLCRSMGPGSSDNFDPGCVVFFSQLHNSWLWAPS